MEPRFLDHTSSYQVAAYFQILELNHYTDKGSLANHGSDGLGRLLSMIYHLCTAGVRWATHPWYSD